VNVVVYAALSLVPAAFFVLGARILDWWVRGGSGVRTGRQPSGRPIERLVSDLHAYFFMKGDQAHSRDLEDLAKDTGNDLHSDGVQVTARLDAGSRVQRGTSARLWYDTSKVAVFDAGSGQNLLPAG
jgi:hypothetical protein